MGVSGSTVTYGGTPVGTFTGGAGATPLVVTFNAAATPAVAQAVLRAVTYHNVSSNPTRGPRIASVVLANGDGGARNTATRTIQLTLPRVLEFQEGADLGFGPYTGAADIEVSENAPNNSYPQGSAAAGLLMDWPSSDVPNAAQTLLRFDSLFGSDPGRIPLGATIVSAELFVTVNNTGDGGKVHRMLIPWDANDETWNAFGNGAIPRNATPGVQADNAEARLAYDSQLGVVDGTGSTGTGTVSLGVTADVQAWSDGAANHGWVLPPPLATSTDDFKIVPPKRPTRRTGRSCAWNGFPAACPRPVSAKAWAATPAPSIRS